MPEQAKKYTRKDAYRKAIYQMEEGLEALDNARANLHEIRMEDDLQTGSGPYRITFAQLVDRLESILEHARSYECDECGEKVLDHAIVDLPPGACDWWAKGVR